MYWQLAEPRPAWAVIISKVGSAYVSRIWKTSTCQSFAYGKSLHISSYYYAYSAHCFTCYIAYCALHILHIILHTWYTEMLTVHILHIEIAMFKLSSCHFGILPASSANLFVTFFWVLCNQSGRNADLRIFNYIAQSTSDPWPSQAASGHFTAAQSRTMDTIPQQGVPSLGLCRSCLACSS